jgi:hypothetical protein
VLLTSPATSGAPKTGAEIRKTDIIIKQKIAIRQGDNLFQEDVLEIKGPVFDISITNSPQSTQSKPTYKVLKRINKVFKLTSDSMHGQAIAIAEVTPSKHFILMNPKPSPLSPTPHTVLSFIELEPSRARDTGLITTKFSVETLGCTHIAGFESSDLYTAFILCNDSDFNSKLITVAIVKKNIYKREHFVKIYELTRRYYGISVHMVDDKNYLTVLSYKGEDDNRVSVGWLSCAYLEGEVKNWQWEESLYLYGVGQGLATHVMNGKSIF